MKKRLLAMLLALSMVLCMMPLGVVAEGQSGETEYLEEQVPTQAVEETVPGETVPEATLPETVEVEEVAAEQNAAANATAHKTKSGYARCGHGDESVTWVGVSEAADIALTSSGHYYLENGIALDGSISVAEDVDITICLNGFNLSAPTTGNIRRIFRIAGGAKVTVCDCSAQVGTLIPGTSKGGVAWIGESGEGFALYDAVVNGSGVTNSGTGGAICMETATGSVLVKDATIKNCTATYGGAIFVSSGTSVVLENATITGNTATQRGGGFDHQTGNIVTVGGKTVITGNYVGKVQQNMNLVNGNRVLNISTTAPLTEGACIGISTQKERATATDWAVTTATTQTDAAKYFFSDMGHEMVMKDGKVTIQTKAHTPGDYKHAHEGVATWTGTSSLPTTTGYYYLTSNVYLTSAVSVSSAQNIVLCLNGYNIYQTGSGRIYRLDGGAKLTICDCTAHTDASGNYVAGKISGGNAATAGAFYMNASGTTFNFYDGIITGNTTSGNGTVVNLSGATFNMYGGEITGNTVTGNGGAVYNGGTFNMSGGTISGNTSNDATIQIQNGTATLSGGIIKNNTVTNTAEAGILTVAAGTTTLSGVTISGSCKGVLVNGGTVNMTGGKLTGITVADNASAAVVAKGGTFTLSGGEISNNTSRGVLVAGGTFNLSGTGKVANHTFSAFDGAGVRVNSGKFIMTGGEISGNDSGKSSGAGIRVGGGTATLSGGKITGNTAANGAAVLVSGGAVTMSGTEVSGNTATGNGVVRIDSGSLNITGGKITGNTANKWGAVFTNGGTFTMTGGEISGNSAAVNGGGLYLLKGNVTIGGAAVIKNNTVGGKANNIYLPVGQKFALSAFTQGASLGISADLAPLYENGELLLATNAVQDGLLAYVSYDAAVGHTLQVKDNNLYLIQDPKSVHTPHAHDDCGHENVTWQPWGDTSSMPAAEGHYYLTSDVDVASMVSITTEQEITVCLNGFDVTGTNRIYRLANGANVSICDCKAYTDSNGNYVAGKLIPGTSKGGVVGLFRDQATDAAPGFTLYSGIIDGTGVTNENTGIAIRLESHGTVNIVGGEIRGCTNPEGVITMTNGTLNISGGKITGNNARAVLVTAGTFNFSGGEISHNTFSKTEGVGVRVQSGVFNMTGGKITGNDAGEKGTAAGIRVADGEVTISGGEISGNTAFKAPGILVAGGKVTIEEGALITGNISHSPDSGAIHQIGGTVTMTGGEISGNQVRGLYIFGTNNPAFILAGGAIKNNNSNGRDGAGVRFGGGSFTMTGGEISGNDAGESSVGGMRVDGGTVKLTGGKITGNKAKSVGGLMVVGGTVYTENFEISNHAVAGNGGGVYQSGGSLTLGTGTVISGNEAWTGGGVFCVAGDLTIDGASVTGNTASQRGGGVDFASDGVLTINGAAKITGNTAKEKASNLVLVQGDYFVTEGLDEGCQIGIISDLEKMYAEGKLLLGKGVAADELAYFTNDMEGGHTLTVLEDGLYILQNPDTIHTPHEHDECGHSDVVWTAWTDSASLPTTAGHYYLVGDVELTKAVAVSAAEEITLCLNGYDVKQTGEGQRIYRLSGGAVLNLCDCTAYTANDGSYISGKLTGGNTGKDAGAGAVYAADAGTKFTLYSGKLSGNKSEGSGGAVVVQNGAVFTMHGGEVSGNTAGGNGAGVYVNKTKAELLGGKITGNTATGEGGGVYCAESAVKLDGTKITSNRGESAGGGMIIGKESTLEFVSGEVSNNKGKNGGGMVIQSKGYVNMTGGRISGNQATVGNGGGVFVSREGTFNLRGGTISGNTSKKTGGGLYISDKANIYSGSITGNHAGKEGGGMYITEASWKDANGATVYSDGVVNMYGGTISGNTTSASAAGVLVRGQRGVFNLRGGTITGNKAMNGVDGYGHGGGIIAQGKGNFNMYGGSITNNECAKTSGGVGAYSGATVKLCGGTISGNKAYQGAGVCLASDSTIDGVTITKNTAEFEGGGLYVNGCTVTMDSGIISENEIVDGNGAGVVLRAGAVMIFNDGEIIKNQTPEGSGGGILIQSSAALTMNGGLVAENYASLSGGGIRSSRCKVEILGGEIRDNVCDVSGGGVYGETVLIMKNCSVTGNRITGDKGGNSGGAGIYLANRTEYTLENVTVSDNYAIGKAGGIHIGYRCDGTITGCTFTKNSASGNGGGILVYLIAKVVLEDTVVEANSAVGNGGGIFVEPDSVVTVDNCVVSKNSAKSGGGIHIGAKSVAYVTDTDMSGNSALVDGGAVYANGGLYLTDVKITGSANKAESAAVVLDNAGHDGESYIPSVNQFKGNVVISGNQNGDLMLLNDAFVNIHGDGLGAEAEILVYNPDGGITDIIAGPYDYVRNGDIYTITSGEDSLHVADPVTKAAEESTEETPVQEDTTEATGGVNWILMAVIGAAIVVLIAIIAILAGKRKKNSKK